MKRYLKFGGVITCAFALCLAFLVGCASQEAEDATDDATTTEVTETAVYINNRAVDLSTSGEVDLPLLTVEDGVTVSVETVDGDAVYVDGVEVTDSVYMDITSITRDEVIEVEVVSDGVSESYSINLMPSTFPDYTTEGESTTDGDFYMTTYDLSTNYIFKLNNQGELIFYKAVTKIDEDGNEVNTNAMDFRKYYNSDGEVRYTYMPYLEDSFADGDISGINPGCVIIMDEDYNVIDEVYYTEESGNEIMIDPHGFIYIDDGHYILTAYKQETVSVPEDLGATDNLADLAVLYIQEIQDGEILWEFCSTDYEQFYYETNSVTWSASTNVCYDYMHFNSMYIDSDGNLLVSCRHLDAILKISRDDGSLVWQLGGEYDDFGLTDDQLFSYQHSIILTDDGEYMIFDNADAAVEAGESDYSSVIRLTVDEESMSVTSFVRYTVLEYYSNYMGAVRELDGVNNVYLWSVGGNYLTDTENPPEYSMIEYTEIDGVVTYNFCFSYDSGTGRLYAANKCV